MNFFRKTFGGVLHYDYFKSLFYGLEGNGTINQHFQRKEN